jgi:hypothetical protein
MKIGTLAKQNMLIECKSHKIGSLRQKKTVKVKYKKRYRFKKATLCEREVIKKQEILFAGRSFYTHTTCG